MGEIEVKLFIHALAQINQRDTELPPIRIPVTAIVGNKPSGKDYTNVWKACQDLAAQHINVLPVGKRGRRSLVNIISNLELDPGTGLLTGDFNPKAAPYLLKLKDTGNFTSAEIEKLLTFKNPNSARLYWILLSYRNLGSRSSAVKKQIELDELKGWMLTDKDLYPIYTEFKRRVLDPIAEDFTSIGFPATWEPVRSGKKTTALTFLIPKDKPAPKPKALPAATDTASFTSWLSAQHDNLQRAYAGLLDKNQLSELTAQEVVRYVAAHPEKHASFFTTRHRIATHKESIANMRSFTLAALNTALGTDFK